MPRNLPIRDEQRIQAAVTRGAITPARAEWWRVQAAAGHDISQVDQLVGGLLDGLGTVAASAAPRDTDGEYPEYRALFGPSEAGQRMADDRAVAARAAVAALTDDQVYEAMFGKASAPAAPVTASSAGPAVQRRPGEAARTRYRVNAPHVSLRVPRDPSGVAAGADPAQTSWRTIELRGGDLVPGGCAPGRRRAPAPPEDPPGPADQAVVKVLALRHGAAYPRLRWASAGWGGGVSSVWGRGCQLRTPPPQPIANSSSCPAGAEVG